MSDSSKVWIPLGARPGTAQALSVPNPGRQMTPGLYLDLLTSKLDKLIQADPKGALQAMEMSQEQAPELWSIAQQYPPSQWASQLVRSDQMQGLLAPLSWKGLLDQPTNQSLREILELLA